MLSLFRDVYFIFVLISFVLLRTQVDRKEIDAAFERVDSLEFVWKFC
jgi:hypothetical protein